MKRIITIPVIACMAIATSVVSCKKSSKSTTTPTPTSTGSTPTPNVGNVDGGLVSIKINVTTLAAGFPVTITTESGVATFFTATGNNATFVDGGAVTVNSVALEKQSNNSYLKLATVGMTPADLDFGSGNSNWSVAGAGSVPAFTYNHSVSFPSFTGSMPDTITRSAGLTISLGGNLSNADSVIIMIAQGSTSILRTFAGSATSATIPAADLASLGVVNDNTAILEVVPYRYNIVAQGGKSYAFIKEQAMVKYICIK